MSDCSQLGKQLSAHLDGELPASESDRIARHLETCPDCAAEAAAYRETGALLRRRLDAEAAAHDLSHLPDRITRQLDAARDDAGVVIWLREHRGPVLALAAAALLLVALLLGPLLLFDEELPAADCVVELVEPPAGYDAKVIEGQGQDVTVIWLYEKDAPPDVPAGSGSSL